MIGKPMRIMESEGFLTIQFIRVSSFRLKINDREINLN